MNSLNLEIIKNEFDIWCEKGKDERLFLKFHSEFIDYLKKYFKSINNKKNSYLIYRLKGNEIEYCPICGKEKKFKNLKAGYFKTCSKKECYNNLAKNLKPYKKCICENCKKEFMGYNSSKFCSEKCKKEYFEKHFKCLKCKQIYKTDMKSEFIKNANICKNCELEYIFKSNKLKNYCDLPSFYICKNCGKVVYGKTKINGKKIDFCSDCRKICPVCGKRFGGQNLCCSKECSIKRRKQTNIKKYGVEHNLKIKGVRRNQVEYWLNKGFDIINSYFQVYKFNANEINGPRFRNLEEFDNYILKMYSLFNEYNYDIFIHIINIGNGYLKKIFDLKYKDLKFGNKNIFKKQIADRNYIFWVKDNNKLYKFRSTNEFIFYQLCKENKIEFIYEKNYPNSNLKYDFYLPYFNEYIEIAGFMDNKEYKEKMEFKNKEFGAVILKNKNEIFEYFEKLKRRIENENKKN